jgi:hypothetical protein
MPDANVPYSFGVLFVHGIGAQRRGEALAAFGSATHGGIRKVLD